MMRYYGIKMGQNLVLTIGIDARKEYAENPFVELIISDIENNNMIHKTLRAESVLRAVDRIQMYVDYVKELAKKGGEENEEQ